VIHPDEALAMVEAIELRLGSEPVGLGEALGRVPARDLAARVDQPPFDKSAMDGFAYARPGAGLAARGESFRLVGSVAAGGRRPPRIGPGECLRIMTGAPVPEGAAAVQRLERASASGSEVRIMEAEEETNIVARGSNKRAGESLFPRRPLRAQDIGILAANGFGELDCARRPRVAVLSTGDELRAAEGGAGLAGPLGDGLIFDSNGPQLVAQARAAGCEARFCGIVPDEEEALVAAIQAAAADAELLIVSGGVSAGDFDFVPRAAVRAGFGILFHGLAMKPGKPALLGRREDRFIYGMPGNPLSAFVNFEVIARPLLMRLMGLRYEPATARVRMAEAVARRETDRVEFLPVAMLRGMAWPVRYTGSTMLDALASASGLVRLEIGQSELGKGEETDARLL
jgi:molybdopterin molybdotransferase